MAGLLACFDLVISYKITELESWVLGLIATRNTDLCDYRKRIGRFVLNVFQCFDSPQLYTVFFLGGRCGACSLLCLRRQSRTGVTFFPLSWPTSRSRGPSEGKESSFKIESSIRSFWFP